MAAHNKLVEVVQKQDGALKQLRSAVPGVLSGLDSITYHNPSYLATQLGRFITQMKLYVVQQAQHCRLAVDLLPPAQLQTFNNKLQLQA